MALNPFTNRVSHVRTSGDVLRAGAAPTPPPVDVFIVAMPIYVIVEEGRTQALIGKPETE
jgi:hypothetical protein